MGVCILIHIVRGALCPVSMCGLMSDVDVFQARRYSSTFVRACFVLVACIHTQRDSLLCASPSVFLACMDTEREETCLYTCIQDHQPLLPTTLHLYPTPRPSFSILIHNTLHFLTNTRTLLHRTHDRSTATRPIRSSPTPAPSRSSPGPCPKPTAALLSPQVKD